MEYEMLAIEDFSQLVELEERYKASVGEDALGDRQAADLLDAIQTGKIEFFVAKEQEKVVAMCSVATVFSTFACKTIGIFEDFFVDEEYRHKGIDRGLTRYVFEVLKERDISALWVGSADVDVEMYKSIGFTMPLGNLLTWRADG